MDLDATGGIRGVCRTDLIATEDLASGVVELIMVNLGGCECHIEWQLDIRGERHILHLAGCLSGWRIKGHVQRGARVKELGGQRRRVGDLIAYR